jgi:tetratricopeptide (TPR) repeat protein
VALKLGLTTMGIRLVQALLGSLACAGIAWATTRYFGRRAGLLAGLLMALYAPAIFFDWLLQKSVLDEVLIAALLCILARSLITPSVAIACLSGMTVGLLALSRENAIVVLVPLAVWFGIRSARKTSAMLAVLLGAAAALGPVILRNSIVGGDLIVTTSQAGPNFFIGNNSAASGSYVPLRQGRGTPEAEELDARTLAEAAAGRSLGPAQVSSFWFRQAIVWIRGHPVEWLRLLAWKSLLALNAAEMVDTEDEASHAEYSPILRVTRRVWHFGVLFPIAVFGLAVSASRWRDLWPLHVVCGAFFAGTVLFYVLARYRYPLVPVLMVFAGHALSVFPGWWRAEGPRRKAVVLGVVLVAAGVANVRLVPAGVMQAPTAYNLGLEYERRGDLDEAQRQFTRAAELWPSYGAAVVRLTGILSSRGEHALALQILTQAAERPGASAQVHMALGAMLAQENRFSLAEKAFGDALRVAPDHFEALTALGALLFRAGEFDQAVVMFERASRANPNSVETRTSLRAAQSCAASPASCR